VIVGDARDSRVESGGRKTGGGWHASAPLIACPGGSGDARDVGVSTLWEWASASAGGTVSSAGEVMVAICASIEDSGSVSPTVQRALESDGSGPSQNKNWD
jgi:hypothetical protein